MKYPVVLLFLILGCGTTKPIPQPIPIPITVTKVDTIHITVIKRDTATITVFNVDTVKHLTVLDFGAVGDGRHDDIIAFELARDYVITHPNILEVPVGNYYISRPLLLQYLVNGVNKYFTIHMRGVLPNKSASSTFLSNIICGFKSGYGIGMQFGRGIKLENLTITGQYTLPNFVTNANIGILKFSDWVDPTITDTRYAPYAAIVIDPNQNASGARGGTSDVTIQNCSIQQWMVGICLSPNGVTQNDEMINILETNIGSCRIAISICQDQSKTININGLKVWASVHTVLDGVSYGAGTGGGSIFCDNWNIAGNVNELFNVTTGRFPLSASRIYGESIFRIGTVNGQAGANFRDFEVDFLTGPGMPAADYLFYGSATFDGGCMRYYDDSYSHRMNWANLDVHFCNMTLNNPLITRGLYGIPTNHYPEPVLNNIKYFYTPGSDSLVKITYITDLIVDRSTWSASCTCPSAKVGDYILAAPTNTTGSYYDRYLNTSAAPTIQIGRVTSVSGSHITIDDVGLNAYSGQGYDAFYIDRIK